MARRPVVKPKTNGTSNARPYSVSKDEAYARKLQAEEDKLLEDDEKMARELQEELLLEQTESDAALARRLYQEDRGKPPMNHRHYARPVSATPIRNLFEALFNSRHPTLDLDNHDDDNDESEPSEVVTPSTLNTETTPTKTQTPPTSTASGTTGTTSTVTGRSRRPHNRSPERARRPGANRSPERRVRGAARPAQRRGSNSDTTTDLLPGVRPNPAYNPNRRPVGQRLIVGTPALRTVEPEDTDQPANVHPIGAISRPGLVAPGISLPVQPPSLPEGEYDPDMLLLDVTPREESREDNFINIMRDPFLLMLLLMGRSPGMMIPDDVDLHDYEALWDLAERVGEVKSRGMKEEEIDRLPVREFHKKSGSEATGEECRVCLTGYKPREKIQVLPCQHEYHQSCIREWLKRNASCPICRHEVKLEC